MQTVGILGGMGPAAGADFVRLFVNACASHILDAGLHVSDQNYPEHWLAQIPIPDRSLALQTKRADIDQPLGPMLQSIGQLAAIGARCVAIACNTAHAWHGQLQSRYPQIEILNIANEVALQLANQNIKKVALLATTGTYQTGLYEEALSSTGIECYTPENVEREYIMQGIYQGVKANNLPVAKLYFEKVSLSMTKRYGAIPLILGCTEIPLALSNSHVVDLTKCIDPAKVLAKALVKRAFL